jgi:PAS domain S-box-containing protein
MIWQETPYTIPLMIASAFSFLLGTYILFRPRNLGARIGAVVILCSTEWLLTYTMELASAELSLKIFWNRIQYLGIVSVPVIWFVFAAYFTGHEKWLKPRTLILLAIEPLITVFMVFTNEAHRLIWSSVELVTVDSFTVLINYHGLWFSVHIIYSYVMLLLGTLLLIIQTLTLPRNPYRRQAIVLILGASAPGVATALYASGMNPFPYLNISPVAFVVTNLAVAYALFFLRLGDVVPLARETIIENMHDSVIVLDSNNRIVDLNPSAQQLLGDVSPFIGNTIEKVIPESSQMEFGDWVETRREITLDTEFGNRIYDVSISPLVDWGGRITSKIIVLRDITDRKKAEEQIKASLREKDVLLQEVHHRVKNNLQIISSLLSLQSRHIRDEKDLEMLRESQSRLRAMALIHERLYQSENLANINFEEYISALVYGLVQSYGVTGTVTPIIDIHSLSLEVSTAIPCGLIINELVSNSLKHAFPGKRKGEIKIKIHSFDGTIELIVRDNGVGIPEDIDFRTTDTLGLHLVTMLAEDQLNGKINLTRDGGTTFTITF